MKLNIVPVSWSVVFVDAGITQFMPTHEPRAVPTADLHARHAPATTGRLPDPPLPPMGISGQHATACGKGVLVMKKARKRRASSGSSGDSSAPDSDSSYDGTGKSEKTQRLGVAAHGHWQADARVPRSAATRHRFLQVAITAPDPPQEGTATRVDSDGIDSKDHHVALHELEAVVRLGDDAEVPPLFSCGLCAYTSKTRSNINSHAKIHTGERAFRCNLCKYATHISSNLTKHEHKHKGQPSFSCGICTFETVFTSEFAAHQRGHNATGPRSFPTPPFGTQ
jgi:hypothetical protein